MAFLVFHGLVWLLVSAWVPLTWHNVSFAAEVLHMHMFSLNWDPYPAFHPPCLNTHTLTQPPPPHTHPYLSLAITSSFFGFQLKYSSFRETFPECLTPNPRLKHASLIYSHSTLTTFQNIHHLVTTP